MARKIAYSKWKKIVKANQPDPIMISIPIGEDAIEIEVKRTIPITEQMELVNLGCILCGAGDSVNIVSDGVDPETKEVFDAIRALDIEPSAKNIDYVFRRLVCEYYTNLDFSDERATADEVWHLIGNEDIYEQITSNIKDDIWNLEYMIRDEVSYSADPVRRLAARINTFLDELNIKDTIDKLGELADLQEQAEELEVPFKRVISSGT